ncbi:MAG: hypothetical protein KGI08_11615, partial [Thaumarchaeota archaeon]|nr:hypothetical protein [Nitrososphaerota archaeon]
SDEWVEKHIKQWEESLSHMQEAKPFYQHMIDFISMAQELLDHRQKMRGYEEFHQRCQRKLDAIPEEAKEQIKKELRKMDLLHEKALERFVWSEEQGKWLDKEQDSFPETEPLFTVNDMVIYKRTQVKACVLSRSWSRCFGWVYEIKTADHDVITRTEDDLEKIPVG